MQTQESSPRILIADGQPDVLKALRLLLKGDGYEIESAALRPLASSGNQEICCGWTSVTPALDGKSLTLKVKRWSTPCACITASSRRS